MQLEQQETFRIEGPQLEIFGQAESKLPAPAKKRPAAALALVVLALVSVLGIGGAKLNTKYNQVRAIYSASNEHGQSMENDLSLRADAASAVSCLLSVLSESICTMYPRMMERRVPSSFSY